MSTSSSVNRLWYIKTYITLMYNCKMTTHENLTVCLHSQNELAHWTVHVTVQNYACCFSSWLRCNFRTAFILSDRLHIYMYTCPVKSNKNAWMTKITEVEIIKGVPIWHFCLYADTAILVIANSCGGPKALTLGTLLLRLCLLRFCCQEGGGGRRVPPVP